MVRCLLQAKDLLTKFWVEFVYCANYLLNQISTREVCHVTPVEKWYGRKPSVDHLRTFGCVAWANISDACEKKVDTKSHVYIIMGYS